MTTPRPSVERFADAIVRAELARGGGGRRSDVARRIMTRLHEDLGKLVGPAGFDVLCARALVLARRAHPSLAEITAGRGGTFTGFDDAAGDGDGQQEAATAIVAHFIELLVRLVGEDLAMRLVGDSWPERNEEEGKT
jgi:hypothetical protein